MNHDLGRFHNILFNVIHRIKKIDIKIHNFVAMRPSPNVRNFIAKHIYEPKIFQYIRSSQPSDMIPAKLEDQLSWDSFKEFRQIVIYEKL